MLGMKLHLSLASALLLGACSTQPSPIDAGRDARTASEDAFNAANDAPASADDAFVDDAFAADAFATGDAFTSRDAGVPSDAPSTSGTSILMTYRTQMGTFDRAFMGYVRTGDAITGLYFELSRGADDACPSMSSPVPQQIITIDGFAPPTPAAQVTGIMARFFDFEGSFREELAPDAPTMSRVEVTAVDTTAGTAEGNVTFTFADGTASGNFRATHCVSLDTVNED